MQIGEKRKASRYFCAATALIKTGQGPELYSVRVLGLGIAGCRIEIDRRLEVDQEFELIIKPDGEDIVATVAVKYWHAKGFAGLHFVRMSEVAKKRLERLVEYISKTFTEPEAAPPA